MTDDPPKPRRWFQFRLRTLLIGVLVLSLPLSWFAVRMERARRQRVAIAAIRRLGGRVHYETMSSAPEWARDVLGVHSFLDIAIASPTAAFGDDEAKCFKDLPDIRGLQLGDVQITDAGLENFRGLTHLWKLYLNKMEITGTGLKHLKELPGLRMLVFVGTPVTDSGLQHLGGLPSLEILVLYDTEITDAGLATLRELPGLKSLKLRGPDITDAGLEYLKGLSKLEFLMLWNTKITPEGVNDLQESLPNCHILYLPPLCP